MIIARLLGLVAQLRGKRAMHPNGRSYRASFWPTAEGARLLTVSPSATVPADVRFSRSAGFPDSLPDLHGIALRLHVSPGTFQDILVVTSGHRGLFKHIFLPARGFLNRWYSSALPYQVDGKRSVFMISQTETPHYRPRLYADLEQARQDYLEFSVWVVSPDDNFTELGHFELDEQWSGPAAEAERFNPWHCIASFQPVGWINRLRKSAYMKSQEARTKKA